MNNKAAYRAVSALLVAVTLALAWPPMARAQYAPFNWFQHFFQPPRPFYPPPMREQRYERRQVQIRPHIYRPAPRFVPRFVERKPKPAPVESVKASFFVAVMGDSLAQLLAQGLAETFEDRPDVAILRKARENSGLVRSDFYDWVKGAHDLLASGEKINVGVMLIGSNDHQTLRDGAASYEPHTGKWDEIYANRIDAIAEEFRAKKIPLIWVGLPIMKSDRMSKEALALNEMYKDHASKNGATYLDIWEAFGDEHGAFAATGPDVEGQVTRLRSGDGVHFTKAGARKLAHFVEEEVKKVLDATEPEDETQFAKLPPGSQGIATPDQQHQKPPVGPVRSLTGAPTSPGAILASRPPAAPVPTGGQDQAPEAAPKAGADDPQSSAAEKGAPRPDRADDFSWPPH